MRAFNLQHKLKKGEKMEKSSKPYSRIVLSVFIVVVMIISTSFTAFATGESVPSKQVDNTKIINENVRVTQISSTSLEIEENEETFFISTETVNDEITKTVIENKDTGETEYFIVNTQNETIYSSITGETLQRSDFEEVEYAKDSSTLEENLLSVGADNQITEVSSTKEVPSTTYLYTTYHKCSYAKLHSMIGTVGTYATIAGAILSLLALFGVPVVTTIATVIGFLGGISAVYYLAMNTSSSHGFKAKVKHYRCRVCHGGYFYTVYQNKISNIFRY